MPGFWWMVLREVVGGIAEGFLGCVTGLISFILFATSRDRKSLHDLIAGTVVLYDPQQLMKP